MMLQTSLSLLNYSNDESLEVRKAVSRYESFHTQVTFTVPVKFEDEISKLVADFLEKNK